MAYFRSKCYKKNLQKQKMGELLTHVFPLCCKLYRDLRYDIRKSTILWILQKIPIIVYLLKYEGSSFRNYLSINAFLASLRRFITRRGIPKTIHSNNGKNFVETNKELQRFYDLLKTKNIVVFYHPSNVGKPIRWNLFFKKLLILGEFEKDKFDQ